MTLQTTILIGAGASVSAGLPSAYDLCDELIENLVKRRWACDELRRLVRNNRSDMRDEFDFIRFETLLTWINDVYKNLDFFNFLDNYITPSPLQDSIARCVCDGAIIITPNFDDLIEYAIAKLGNIPNTIDAHHFNMENDDLFTIGNVIKLHGSWNYHKNKKIYRKNSTIHATIDLIASENPGNLLNLHAKKILKKCVDNRRLIVIGYSASDALDIVPALYECNPREVHWVSYADKPVVCNTISEYINKRSLHKTLESWEMLTKNWAEKGTNVNVYLGTAEEAMQILTGSEACISTKSQIDKIWKKTIKNWTNSVKRNDPTGLGFAGLLFGEFRRNELADKALKESRGYRDKTCGWSSARRKYEIAQNTFFFPASDLNRVIKLSKQAKKEGELIYDDRIVEFSTILEGRCAFCKQEWSKAIEIFNSPIFNRYEDCYKRHCKTWIGRTYTWAGKYNNAISYLESAKKYLIRIGDIEELIDALDALGGCRKSIGKYRNALKDIIDADEYAHLHGFSAQRFCILIELANIYYFLGEIVQTESKLDIASKILSPSYDDEISDYWLLKANVAILKKQYSDALVYLKISQKGLTMINRYYLSEILIKCAFCQLNLYLNNEATASINSVKILSNEECSPYGIALMNCLELYLGQNTKSETDKAIIVASLSACEIQEASLICKRFNIGSSKIASMYKKAIQIVNKEHADYWLNELQKT